MYEIDGHHLRKESGGIEFKSDGRYEIWDMFTVGDGKYTFTDSTINFHGSCMTHRGRLYGNSSEFMECTMVDGVIELLAGDIT